MDVKYVETPEDYVGQTICSLYPSSKKRGATSYFPAASFSNRNASRPDRTFSTHLSTGMVLSGTVSRLMPYGAFVELIPGVEGMVHISELSWSRIENPNEAVNPGDRVQVKVISIDSEGGSGSEKISLSVKQLRDDPWESAGDRFQTGDIVNGRVKRCTHFGAFVEIEPGN